LPVIASSTPSSCFDVAYRAVKIAVEHMTPVLVLSDGYIANGAEPWKFPKSADLEEINVGTVQSKTSEEKFMPYLRDEKLVRQWAVPGTEGLEHRIGGLEKEDVTGNVSYDPENHQKMVKIREEKVERIADFIPKQSMDSGKDKGKILVLGWGSTYGSIKSAVVELIADGYEVSHAHLTYIKPFPRNLGEVLNNFDKILIPEINNGQLIKLIRDKYLIDAIGFNKIKGTPLTRMELREEILNLYHQNNN
jgi:2-oxoglutarate ferredoxin oxidoreductase subunit alpha